MSGSHGLLLFDHLQSKMKITNLVSYGQSSSRVISGQEQNENWPSMHVYCRNDHNDYYCLVP